MADESRKPDARPVYRMLAGGVAVVCFLLAAVFAFVPAEGSTRDSGLRPSGRRRRDGGDRADGELAVVGAAQALGHPRP